jgi:N-acetyl-anhydromuramyl-L-alanine amidase AmpD
MLALTHPTPNRSKRIAEPVAVCVHWTGGPFFSAVDWCMRRSAAVSYHEIIDRNGDIAVLVPPEFAAWSVGKSQAPEPWQRHPHMTAGNALTYNIALSGGPPILPTATQIHTLIDRIVDTFAHFGWDHQDRYRITGHDAWAWPRGRKSDPTGNPKAPWLDLDAIRTAVGARP